MEHRKTCFKFLIIIVILFTCMISSSCEKKDAVPQSDGKAIKMTDNSNYNDIKPIQVDNLKILSENDIKIPFKYNGCSRISNGMYLFLGQEWETLRIGLYSTELGALRENTTDIFSPSEIIYDDKHQNILLLDSRYKIIRDIENPKWFDEDRPAVLLALDMDLVEKWRIETADNIANTIIIGDFYYIIRDIRKEGLTAEDMTTYDTAVDKVSAEGEILVTFKKENFKIRQIISQNGHVIICGEQTNNKQTEYVIMRGDDEEFFSEGYSVISSIGSPRDFYSGIIENGNLVLYTFSNLRGDQKNSKYCINLIDINTLEVIKTVDITKILRKYEIDFEIILYGDNKDKMLLIGKPILFNSRLRNEGIQLLLIPVNNEWEIHSVYAVNTEPFVFSSINAVTENDSFLHFEVETNPSYLEGHKERIIEFDIFKQYMEN